MCIVTNPLLLLCYQVFNRQQDMYQLQYTLLLYSRYLRVVGEGQNITHYCLFDISEQQERDRTIHISVYQLPHQLVGEGQNNTHYCLFDISEISSRRGLEQYTLLLLLDISDQQERPRTIQITVYQISAEQQERNRTIHITVYQISQSSRRGIEQYTLVSIRYLRIVLRELEQCTVLPIRYFRVVGGGQNNTHYCLVDISEQQERDRAIDISVYQVSQSSMRALEQYKLLFYSIYSEQQERARTIHITVQLLDISEQQERDRTIHISVYSIPQSSMRGLEQYTLLPIRYPQSSRRGLGQYTLLSIQYLRVVSNTHYCLLVISQ